MSILPRGHPSVEFDYKYLAETYGSPLLILDKAKV